MNNFIRLLILISLIPYQAMGDELSFFSDGINYWAEGKKN